jgi:hypothetical protein
VNGAGEVVCETEGEGVWHVMSGEGLYGEELVNECRVLAEYLNERRIRCMGRRANCEMTERCRCGLLIHDRANWRNQDGKSPWESIIL